MRLTTERLMMRPWKNEDASSLYEYAKDPKVGPAAGWPIHTSVEYSRHVIKEYLSGDGIFAVTLKDVDSAIGSVGILRAANANFKIGGNDGEIGYWIGVPYWGQGLIPEAVREITRFGFEEMDLSNLWCGYFDGNEQSKRVQEKCGYRYDRTEKDKEIALIGEIKTEHITCLTKEQWLERRINK